ncbi:MAG: putative DNA modification/repair radical SAM protein [Clostridia bacterium]|nr:putative DNA modification/repair radical SAM protein [Clostridia bacterium]
MDIMQKLEILTDSAKYDAACTSSGSDRSPVAGKLGGTCAPGICHSFSADGRCISLLKVLQSNVCMYDCQYCVNRRSNDVPRASFTPRELADLTIGMYRRNYIEGLFLSSGVSGTPDHAMEEMIRTIRILREEYGFRGYIHAKAIPGCSPEAVELLGRLVDRMSVNIELPSEQGLKTFAPAKTKQNILAPMRHIRDGITQSKEELAVYRHVPKFVPAGQSTQMIVGATPDTDRQILRLTEGLYKQYGLKRVFFSAYIPVGTHALLPKNTPPPLLREHRLYQTDWLLRFYGFSVDEIVDEEHPSLDPFLDPKCAWALRHPEYFPVEINRADKETLLHVPGIGVKSALRILRARRVGALRPEDLKKLGVVVKRAKFFVTCNGRRLPDAIDDPVIVYRHLAELSRPELKKAASPMEQLTLFPTPNLPTGEDVMACLTGQL